VVVGVACVPIDRRMRLKEVALADIERRVLSTARERNNADVKFIVESIRHVPSVTFDTLF
jgi:hypothetical protein